MRFHGNYCGPNWSDGKAQRSVVSTMPGIDEFDESCRRHDAVYARGGDVVAADHAFFLDNIGKGGKRTAAALAVGTQAVVRASDKFIPKIYKDKKMTSLRGHKVTSEGVTSTNQRAGDSRVTAPAVVGSVLRGQETKQVKAKDGSLKISSTVCLGRPNSSVQTTVPEMVAMQYLHPAVLGNDEIQNMTRVYERYRITKALIRFRAFQGTTAGGEVMIVSNADPNYRPINTGTNASFYQRALATKHSLLTPIWCPETLELAVDTRWKVCDNSNSSTIEEFSSGVVYVYVDGTNLIAGYFLLELEVEFRELRFNSRNLISGSFQSLGVRNSLTFVAPTLGANAVATIAGMTPGDIYSIVLSSTNATYSAGSASTLLTLSTGSGTIAYTIGGSNLVYARANSTTTADIFSTYDSAIGGDTSDRFLYGVTSGSTTTLPACIVIQLRNSAQPTL